MTSPSRPCRRTALIRASFSPRADDTTSGKERKKEEDKRKRIERKEKRKSRATRYQRDVGEIVSRGCVKPRCYSRKKRWRDAAPQRRVISREDVPTASSSGVMRPATPCCRRWWILIGGKQHFIHGSCVFCPGSLFMFTGILFLFFSPQISRREKPSLVPPRLRRRLRTKITAVMKLLLCNDVSEWIDITIDQVSCFGSRVLDKA